MSSHYKNTCPGCNAVEQCRCMGPRVETKNPCAKCKELVNEEAAAGATSAASVAGIRGSLFGGSMPRRQRKSVKGIPVIRYSNKLLEKKPKPKLSENATSSFLNFLKETVGSAEDNFDSADVISKLARNAEVSDELDGDELAVFGLEDADGGITKVYVPAEQGKDFEKALGDALRQSNDNGQTEIAALMFELKDKFKIVDVVWPTVQEDEEEVPAAGAPGAPGSAPGGEAAVGTDGAAPPAAPGVDPTAPPPVDGMDPANAMGGPAAPGADMAATAQPTDMIAQILDMLKADAEARKAESAAKTAEAQAKEAEAATKLAAVKLQGEEGVLDAEAYFKQKKEEKKEGDRLKMLARYRQETQLATPDQPQGEVKPAGQEAPQGAVPQETPRDEEEEQITSVRKHLLGLLNGAR